MALDTVSKLSKSSDQPTLWFFVHPQCKCTDAAAGELSTILDEFPDTLALKVVLYAPSHVDEDWDPKRVEDWRHHFQRATVLVDTDGTMARAFGATTSGHAVLVDRKGTVVFQGGLNFLRGHEGPGPGAFALREFLLTGKTDIHVAPTFGCAIVDVEREGK